MPISEKEIEKYGSYARAYYYLVRRPTQNRLKSYKSSKGLIPSEETINANKPNPKNIDENSYYRRNREKVLQKAKEKYRNSTFPERPKVISDEDIVEHGSYSSAYYYKVLQPQRVVLRKNN